jgi:hypothetical protein
MIRAAADLMYLPSPRGFLGIGDLRNVLAGRGGFVVRVVDMLRVGGAELGSEAG